VVESGQATSKLTCFGYCDVQVAGPQLEVHSLHSGSQNSRSGTGALYSHNSVPLKRSNFWSTKLQSHSSNKFWMCIILQACKAGEGAGVEYYFFNCNSHINILLHSCN
jgi:hypothetical protein